MSKVTHGLKPRDFVSPSVASDQLLLVFAPKLPLSRLGHSQFSTKGKTEIILSCKIADVFRGGALQRHQNSLQTNLY